MKNVKRGMSHIRSLMLQLSYGAEWNCKSIWQPAGRMADHPSGYLFAEGCDRFLLVPVDADYPFQSCASE